MCYNEECARFSSVRGEWLDVGPNSAGRATLLRQVRKLVDKRGSIETEGEYDSA